MQALGWRRGPRYLQLQDDIATVALWYQTLPLAPTHRCRVATTAKRLSHALGSTPPRSGACDIPAGTDVDVAFFAEHGWIVVEDAIDPGDLLGLEARCDKIIANKEKLAYDRGRRVRIARNEFKILQGSLSLNTHEFDEAPFRTWAVEFASTLMGFEVEFWYDQFLAKPPAERPDALASG
jgi:hypothetical protein